MQNPYGSSPVVAIFQGFVSGTVLTPLSAYGCQLTRVSPGAFILTLDDNQGITLQTIALVTQFYGAAAPVVNVGYNCPGGVVVGGLGGNTTAQTSNPPAPADFTTGTGYNQLGITFGAPTEFTAGIFNLTLLSCYDGDPLAL